MQDEPILLYQVYRRGSQLQKIYYKNRRLLLRISYKIWLICECVINDEEIANHASFVTVFFFWFYYIVQYFSKQTTTDALIWKYLWHQNDTQNFNVKRANVLIN